MRSGCIGKRKISLGIYEEDMLHTAFDIVFITSFDGISYVTATIVYETEGTLAEHKGLYMQHVAYVALSLWDANEVKAGETAISRSCVERCPLPVYRVCSQR